MITDGDHMEVGSLVPLEDGWFLDTTTNRKFRVNEEGVPVDKANKPLLDDES